MVYVAVVFALLGSVSLSAFTAGCTEVPPRDGQVDSGPALIELIGLNGRRIRQDERYWLPFDHVGQPTTMLTAHREALTLLNAGGRDVRIVSLRLLDPSDAGAFSVLAPDRSSQRPLSGLPRTLSPGDKLDFDVRFVPRAPGRVSVTLALTHDGGPPLTVTLEGAVPGSREPVSDLRAINRVAVGEGTSIVDAVAGPDEGIYLTGWSSSSHDAPAPFLARVSASGKVAWRRRLVVDQGLRAIVGGLRQGLALCAGEGGEVALSVNVQRDADAALGILVSRFDADGRADWVGQWVPARGAQSYDCLVRDQTLQLAAAVGRPSSAAIVSIDMRGAAPGIARTFHLGAAHQARGLAIASTGAAVLAGDVDASGFIVSDEHGLQRLHAPVVSLASHHGGEVTALLDDDGQLEIVRLGGDGVPRWRRLVLHPEPHWATGHLRSWPTGTTLTGSGLGGAWSLWLSDGGESLDTVFLVAAPGAEPHIAARLQRDAATVLFGDLAPDHAWGLYKDHIGVIAAEYGDLVGEPVTHSFRGQLVVPLERDLWVSADGAPSSVRPPGGRDAFSAVLSRGP